MNRASLFLFLLVTGCSTSEAVDDGSDVAESALVDPFDPSSCGGSPLTIAAITAGLEASPTGEVNLGRFALHGRSRFRKESESFGSWRYESGGIPGELVLSWNADHTRPVARLISGPLPDDSFGHPRAPAKAACVFGEWGGDTRIYCDRYTYEGRNYWGWRAPFTATTTGTDGMFVGVLHEHCAWLRTTGVWEGGGSSPNSRREFESVLELTY